MSHCRLEDLTAIQNTVEGLEKVQAYLQDRLSSAIENEKELRQALNEETERSKELEELLRQEKEKNECFKGISKQLNEAFLPQKTRLLSLRAVTSP